jgi:general secretion pathway protein D
MLTRQNYRKFLIQGVALAACMVLTLSCGTHKVKTALRESRYDDAITEYRKALRKDPKDFRALTGLRRALPLAAEKHLTKAKEAKAHGRHQEELNEVGMALILDPNNAVAEDWLVNLDKAEIERRNASERADNIEAARIRGRKEADGLPSINPRSLEGLDLNFTRKTEVREIFRHLSKNTGVNIVMHSSVIDKSMPVSIDLRGLTFQRLLDVLMMQSDLFYKVLDTNSIMVFEKNAVNLKEYGQKLVQTFYLSNSLTKDAVTVITKAVPDVKTIFYDARLRTITIMAKPSEIETVRRIIDHLDKAKAEIMIYIELLEVSESVSVNAGFSPMAPMDAVSASLKQPYNIGAARGLDIASSAAYTLINSSVGAGGIDALGTALSSLGLGSTAKLSSAGHRMLSIMPGLKLELAKVNGDAKTLANPNIRVIADEKGTISIGEKISIIKNKVFSDDASKGNLSRSEYEYQDTGVKIEVIANVHNNRDITVDLNAEITGVTNTASAGQVCPNISLRKIVTKVRLRDGEQAIFAGFIKEEERKSLSGIWGLSDVPILGKLFTRRSKEKEKTDIVLSLRAVLVRTSNLQEVDFLAFDPGVISAQSKPFDPDIEVQNNGSSSAFHGLAGPSKTLEGELDLESPKSSLLIPESRDASTALMQDK